MPRGGPRKNAGRHHGAKVTTVAAMARKQAAETGLLPHQWMLGIMRGEPVMQKEWVEEVDERGVKLPQLVLVEKEVYPEIETRVKCAQSAAAFFAPKLMSQAIKVGGGRRGRCARVANSGGKAAGLMNSASARLLAEEAEYDFVSGLRLDDYLSTNVIRDILPEESIARIDEEESLYIGEWLRLGGTWDG